MKLTASALSLVLVSGLAFAEPGPDPLRGPGDHGKHRMLEELDLTDEQREQIREIRESGGSREDIHAVLTAEQQEQLSEAREKYKGSWEERGQRMQEHLGLSDAQLTEIRNVREAGGSREAIRAVLTPEQQEKFDQLKPHRMGQHTRPGGE